MRPSIMGFAIAAAITLATIYLFNKFSGKTVAQLGA